MRSFTGKALLLATLAVLPWPLLLVLYGTDPWLVVMIALATFCSVALLLVLARHLQPITVLAGSFAPYSGEGLGGNDDIARLARGIAELRGRDEKLQHRWTARHPVSGISTREHLATAISDHMRADAAPRLLGAIRLADFRRLSIFDPDLAAKALKRFSQRLVASLGSSRSVAHVDRDCFAIWFGDCDPEAAFRVQRPICSMRPASSRIGTNWAGEIMTRSGCRQRINASAPTRHERSTSTSGWKAISSWPRSIAWRRSCSSAKRSRADLAASAGDGDAGARAASGRARVARA